MPTVSPLIPRHFDHVIYHAGCVDGFTSAWLLHKRCPDAQIHEGRYGEAPPEGMTGVIVIADFSYPPEVMADLCSRVEYVHWLDHRQSAINAYVNWYDGESKLGKMKNLQPVLDIDHSGAALVADWLQVLGPDRELAAYVEDRDLWRFALPHSKEIVAYINAVPMTFEDYDDLAYDIHRDHDGVVQMGHAIGMRNRVLIDQIKDTAREMTLLAPDREIVVPVAASPYGLGSDVARELAEASHYGVGAYYIDYPDRREFGLRSRGEGPDVAKIAEGYGGGGHPAASGFRVMRDERTLVARLLNF